mmetsp:Transcript_6967/g.19705  ORF Transcript_6967/g.19705 Transcript_6967/m.19705 type:complete len:231 (-) Transcript_6967:115-807(-)
MAQGWADRRRCDQAPGIQAEPHIGHERGPVCGLLPHLLRVLRLRQEVARGALQRHQEQAHHEVCQAQVLLGDDRDRRASHHAHQGRQRDVRRFVEAVHGEGVADKADDGLHGPWQLGDAPENLRLRPRDIVLLVDEGDTRHGEGHNEPFGAVLRHEKHDQELVTELIAELAKAGCIVGFLIGPGGPCIALVTRTGLRAIVFNLGGVHLQRVELAARCLHGTDVLVALVCM